MIIRQLQYTLGLCMGLFTVGSIAADSTTQAAIKYTTCPPISKIYKSNENHWGTQDANFRSHTLSFASHLESFLGAQWQGATLGHIICLYKPKDDEHKGSVFPVVLTYNKLVYEPVNQPNWQTNNPKSGELYNCISKHVSDCRFVVRPTTGDVDIYQEAMQLRQEANPNADNNAAF